MIFTVENGGVQTAADRRAVIIGGGDMRDYGYIKSLIHSGDTVVCADGGQYHADKLGLVPDIVTGDFDSSAAPDGNCGTRVIRHPRDKDLTDTELALRLAAESGEFDRVLMLGMLGGRADHALANIFFMLAYDIPCCIADEDNFIFPFKGCMEFNGCKGRLLGIIPVCGDISGVRTVGLKWELNNETLYFGRGRGCSNIVTDDKCVIESGGGMGVIMLAARNDHEEDKYNGSGN